LSQSLMAENREMLRRNSYPGRGIIIGLSADGGNYVQVYWIMGRSVNSRNRVFEEEDGFVRTRAHDKSKVIDPSLIIYYPAKHYQRAQIISNGDQTETILDALSRGGTFEEALWTREFEPDAPNFTPRISGLVDLDDTRAAYRLSIIKTHRHDPNHCERHFFNYAKGIPGAGHCLHTYAGDGDPLPSFDGEPYLLALGNGPEETAGVYWGLLNEENRVALMAKFINISTGKIRIAVINKLGKYDPT